MAAKKPTVIVVTAHSSTVLLKDAFGQTLYRFNLHGKFFRGSGEDFPKVKQSSIT